MSQSPGTHRLSLYGVASPYIEDLSSVSLVCAVSLVLRLVFLWLVFLSFGMSAFVFVFAHCTEHRRRCRWPAEQAGSLQEEEWRSSSYTRICAVVYKEADEIELVTLPRSKKNIHRPSMLIRCIIESDTCFDFRSVAGDAPLYFFNRSRGLDMVDPVKLILRRV